MTDFNKKLKEYTELSSELCNILSEQLTCAKICLDLFYQEFTMIYSIEIVNENGYDDSDNYAYTDIGNPAMEINIKGVGHTIEYSDYDSDLSHYENIPAELLEKGDVLNYLENVYEKYIKIFSVLNETNHSDFEGVNLNKHYISTINKKKPSEDGYYRYKHVNFKNIELVLKFFILDGVKDIEKYFTYTDITDALVRANEYKLSTKEALSFENIEQRRVYLEYLGLDTLLNDLDAELVDKQTITRTENRYEQIDGEIIKSTVSFDDPHELYKISKEVINTVSNSTEHHLTQDVFILKIICPSSNREYLHFVDPNIPGVAYDAITANASRHIHPDGTRFTKNDFINLINQSA